MNMPEAQENQEFTRAATDDLPLPPRRGRRRARVNVNLTSLIDVTFLLLIYFMVATSMTGREQVYRMDLPNRSGAAGAGGGDPFKLDDEPLRILISTAAGETAAYSIRIDGPYPQPKTFDELEQFLRNAQVNETTTAGLFEPHHPIIIQPAPATRWEHAIEAFNAAAKARYTHVTFGRPNS